MGCTTPQTLGLRRNAFKVSPYGACPRCRYRACPAVAKADRGMFTSAPFRHSGLFCPRQSRNDVDGYFSKRPHAALGVARPPTESEQRDDELRPGRD